MEQAHVPVCAECAAPGASPGLMRNHWYIVAESAELRSTRPLSRRLSGQGLVLFRSPQGEAVALPDRCPHRNVPLSGGRLRKGCLQCPYHGWEFDASGQCVYIPSLNSDEKIPPGARLEPLPLREQQGYIWVWQAATASSPAPCTATISARVGWAVPPPPSCPSLSRAATSC